MTADPQHPAVPFEQAVDLARPVEDEGVVPPVVDEIVAERRRRIEAKGWTPEHDDEHSDGELSLAAALYAIPYENPKIGQDDFIGLHMALEIGGGWNLKPEPDKRRRLVKAAVLIIAEIERLDRLPTPPAGGAHG